MKILLKAVLKIFVVIIMFIFVGVLSIFIEEATLEYFSHKVNLMYGLVGLYLCYLYEKWTGEIEVKKVVDNK